MKHGPEADAMARPLSPRRAALDAGLLAAAQAVEHYEISRWHASVGTKLGMKDAAKLLDQTLAEQKKTDDTLTKIAEQR